MHGIPVRKTSDDDEDPVFEVHAALDVQRDCLGDVRADLPLADRCVIRGVIWALEPAPVAEAAGH